MASSSISAELPAAETLHQLPDEQFAQALIDAGLLKPVSARLKQKSESPVGELLADRMQGEWIKSNLVRRAHRLLPAEAISWSAEKLIP
ncbi:MAG: hypothetical protein KDA65_15475, partial [Planctomycetaceae bacterium]|nr:hypothetical protein [Planctomycetaceae bacterium]